MRASSQRIGDALIVIRKIALAWFCLLTMSVANPAAAAQELSGLARLDPGASYLIDTSQGLDLELAISQPVPYRVSFLSDPARLVVDFREVDFGLTPPASIVRSGRVSSVLWGPFLSGWSRLVVVLDEPFALTSAEERKGADGGAVISLKFRVTDKSGFDAAVHETAGNPTEDWTLPQPAKVDAAIPRQTGDKPLKVVLDPGHGGIDPGAEAKGKTEAAHVLGFALELAEVLRRAGMIVTLTRDTDIFVPLETRISVARAAGADLFISLHADAVPEGDAQGATVYKLDDKASDAASEQLAERHDRADLLAGIDLSGNDDEVANVLMDLARQETRPRTERLAEALSKALQAANIKMHRHPIQSAAFSVLKAADIPSVLLEVGFLSSDKDREHLEDPAWRSAMQKAILSAIQSWSISDAAEARLLRQ